MKRSVSRSVSTGQPRPRSINRSEAPQKNTVDPYPDDHDYCRLLPIFLIAQINDIEKEMCV